MNLFDLSGVWQCEILGQSAPMVLPGTLDENHIGHPDSAEKQWHLSDARAIGLYSGGDPIVTNGISQGKYVINIDGWQQIKVHPSGKPSGVKGSMGHLVIRLDFVCIHTHRYQVFAHDEMVC